MGEPPVIRILLADDHAVVREGLKALIHSTPEMEVVGEAKDGLEAVALARELEPDIILLDMVMPRQDGLEAIQQLEQEDHPARIIVLSSFAEDEQIFPAIKAGASGYLLKDASPRQLITAIREVSRGEVSLHPAIARRVIAEIAEPKGDELPPSDPLTVREVEVLKMVARGYTNSEIAEMLVVSSRTVGKHVSNILEKLHLANRTQATLYALREGLVTLDDA